MLSKELGVKNRLEKEENEMNIVKFVTRNIILP